MVMLLWGRAASIVVALLMLTVVFAGVGLGGYASDAGSADVSISGDTGVIEVVKGQGSPKVSAITASYLPMRYGTWSHWIENQGLRSLEVSIYDNSTGVPDEMFHARIRFSSYDAYPTGTVFLRDAIFAPWRDYLIELTPNGAKGAYALYNYDFYSAQPPVVQGFAYVTNYLAVTADASGAYDPDGTIVSYAWDWGDGVTASGMVATHTYAWAGNYTITLVVTDNDGLSTSFWQVVYVEPRDDPPVASFEYSVSGPTVFVDASSSTDDWSIVRYDWNWGDGTTGTGMIASHDYSNRSLPQYVPMDSSGRAVPPYPYYVVGYTYGPGGALLYNCSVVVMNTRTGEYLTTSSDSTDAFYMVDLIDMPQRFLIGDLISVTAVQGTLAGSNYGFADDTAFLWLDVTLTEGGQIPDTAIVTLTVTDTKGQTGSVSQTITLRERPGAYFTFSTHDLEVSVDASSSHDADGTIVSYSWSWGDGSMGSGMIASHAYVVSGNYTVILLVMDDDGLTNEALALVVVYLADEPPVASFTYTALGSVLAVDASGSSDDHGITNYTWNWGDGTSGTGIVASHEYTTGILRPNVPVDPNPYPGPPRPPLFVFGLVYDPAGVAVPNCTVTIIDLRTMVGLAAITGSSEYDTGYYEVDLNTIQFDWIVGDVLNITASVGPMIGWTTVIVDASMPYIWADVTLLEGDLRQVMVTLSIVDTVGQLGSVTVTLDYIVFLPPEPPVAYFTWTSSDLSVMVDASYSNDSDGTIVSYLWDWGDGTAEETSAAALHDYPLYGTWVVTLTVTDNDGLTDTYAAIVTVSEPPGERSVSWTISNMFELYQKQAQWNDPSMLGHWNGTMGMNSYYKTRGTYYDDKVLRDQYPFMLAGEPYYNIGTNPDVDPGFAVTSWYRMYTEAWNIAELGTGAGKDPIFLPILGNGSLDGGYADMRWYSTYLTSAEMSEIRVNGTHYANTYYGVPRGSTPSPSSDDGWWHELHGMIRLDRNAAVKFLGLPGVGDLRTEFTTNEEAIEQAWFMDWLEEGGGVYDIYAFYGYSLDMRWLELSLDLQQSTSTDLALRFWTISWGNEALLMRYIDAAGVSTGWHAWPDDWYLNITMSPQSGNLMSRATMGYHLTAWKDMDFFSGAWMLESTYMDNAGSTIYHPNPNPYDPYDPDKTNVRRTSWLPGTVNYGGSVSYWTAPKELDLAYGERLTIKLPLQELLGITPYRSSSNVVDSAKLAELTSHSYWGEITMGNGWPSMLGDCYDSLDKTISLVGPIDFPVYPNPTWPGLMEYGSPTFIFDVSAASYYELSLLGPEPLVMGVDYPLMVTAKNLTGAVVTGWNSSVALTCHNAAVVFGEQVHSFSPIELGTFTTTIRIVMGWDAATIVASDMMYAYDVTGSLDVTLYTYTYVQIPLAKNFMDTTGEPVEDLWNAGDGLLYEVGSMEIMAIDLWGGGGLYPEMVFESVVLIVDYTVSSDYSGTQPLLWRLEAGVLASTGITPVATDPARTVAGFDLIAAGVDTLDEILNMDLVFLNDGSSGSVSFDEAWIMVDVLG